MHNTADRLDLSPLLTDAQKLHIDRLTLSQVHHQRSQILQGWMAEYGVPPSQCCLVDLDITGQPVRRTIVSARTEQELAINCRRLLEAGQSFHLAISPVMQGLIVTGPSVDQIRQCYQEFGAAVLACMPGPKGANA